MRGQNAEDAEVTQRTQKNSKKGWGFGSGFSASTSSFPRRWESMPTHAQNVDSRLRGNDGCGVWAFGGGGACGLGCNLAHALAFACAGKSCCIKPFLWVCRAVTFWAWAVISSSSEERQAAIFCCSKSDGI